MIEESQISKTHFNVKSRAKKNTNAVEITRVSNTRNNYLINQVNLSSLTNKVNQLFDQ